MPTPVRTAALWVRRHAFPVAAASVIVLGAAGGGIGYAVASQHSTAAPVSSASGSSGAAPTPVGNARQKGGPSATRGAQVIERALSLLATQTGQSVAAVRSQLESGKSIDQIAGAKAPAIETAILDQVNKLAARALSAGRISAAQDTAGLAMAKMKVEALMAEPGTQLLQDAQNFLPFPRAHGSTHHAGVSPTPTPAA